VRIFEMLDMANHAAWAKANPIIELEGWNLARGVKMICAPSVFWCVGPIDEDRDLADTVAHIAG
jgi:hypothetical protein